MLYRPSPPLPLLLQLATSSFGRIGTCVVHRHTHTLFVNSAIHNHTLQNRTTPLINQQLSASCPNFGLYAIPLPEQA